MSSTDETEGQPVHDCPIQGPGTPLVRSLNIETDEESWTCVWCMMADHILGTGS